jgi:hypothetical protein
VFDIDNPDMSVFEALSDNMKAKIMATPEWQAKDGTQGTTEDSGEPLSDPFAGSDMPDGFLKYDESEQEDKVIEPTEAQLNGDIDLPDKASAKKGK